MTKLRPPLSIEAALSDVIDAIGMDAAIAATGRTKHYLRGLSDPDKRERLTCADAIALDAAHHTALGTRPIHDMMGLKLDARAADAESCVDRLFASTIEAMKESSEADVALFEATRPGASRATRQTAMRELVQSLNARRRQIPILRAMMRQPAQPP